MPGRAGQRFRAASERSPGLGGRTSLRKGQPNSPFFRVQDATIRSPARLVTQAGQMPCWSDAEMHGDRSVLSGMCPSLRRLLYWALAAILGVSVCGAQFGPDEFERDRAEEERLQSEHEIELYFKDILEARRQAAHDRLADAAETMQSQAACPVFDRRSPEPPTFRKQISGPFTEKHCRAGGTPLAQPRGPEVPRAAIACPPAAGSSARHGSPDLCPHRHRAPAGGG